MDEYSDEKINGDDDFDPVASLSGPLLRSVLAEVTQERARQDGDLGFFRDYSDGTAGRAYCGPTLMRDHEGRDEAIRKRLDADRHGKTSWRLLLDEAVGIVVAEGKEDKLRTALIQLAAHSVAWVEAIDRRKDEKRIERKTRQTRWARVAMWFRNKFRRTF